MNWEGLVTGVRKRLRETGGHVNMVSTALVTLTDQDTGPGESETLLLLTVLTSGLDELREACEELLTGLDALAIAMGAGETKKKPPIH